jgi:hypothetical protein
MRCRHSARYAGGLRDGRSASNSLISCTVQKARSSSGGQTCPATVAPAGSNRSSRGGNEAAEAFGGESRHGRLASWQAIT